MSVKAVRNPNGVGVTFVNDTPSSGSSGTKITPQSVNVTTKSGAATTTPISTGIKNGMATGITAALLGSTPIGRVALGVGGALAGAASAAASNLSSTGGQETSAVKEVRPDYSAGYMEARAAGDWQGMKRYNELQNADREAHGEEPQYATDDIELIRRQSEEQAQQAALNYDHSEYLRKMYAAQVESALAGLKGAYDSGMAGYDAALEMLPQRYQGYRNDAAAQSAMAQKNFDERAQASGLNSGASGQAALDASAVYRGTLAQLNQAQANAAAEIDRAKANLRAQYETAVAQARANGDASLAEALYKELIRVDSLAREDEQTAYDREQNDKKWKWETDEQDYQRAAEKAAGLATTGDYSGYAQLWGLSEEKTQRLVEQHAEKQRLTQEQAARDLADWYAAYGDFSKVEALGVKPQLMGYSDTTLASKQRNAPKNDPPKSDDKFEPVTGASYTELANQISHINAGVTQLQLKNLQDKISQALKAGTISVSQHNELMGKVGGQPVGITPNVTAIMTDMGAAAREQRDITNLLNTVVNSGKYSEEEINQILNHARELGYYVTLEE